MQFLLEATETKLLANILLEQDSEQCFGLFSKVMSGDLRFDADELEFTAHLLAAKKEALKDEIARQQNVRGTAELEKKLALLERVKERVEEACVMF